MPIVRVSSWRVIAVQLSVVKHLFTYLFENLEEPSTMPRPLTLTDITVHTKSVTSNDKNKTC